MNNPLLGVEIPLEEVPKSDFGMVFDFQEVRRQIRPLFKILGKVPSSNLERILATGPSPADSQVQIDEKLLAEAEALLQEFRTLYASQKERTSHVWEDVVELWKGLNENEDLELGFTNAHLNVLESLRSFKLQLVQRNEEKQAKIASFISELRDQLVEIWNHCLISEQEKSKFQEFTSEDYTEELLNIHKEELRKWKLYQEKNQEVLDKVRSRELMWQKLKELEARSDDPSRFVNRGGSLLKDQKDLNTLMKALPKLESELKRLATQFEKEHGKKVTILGQDIPQMIDEDWENFREEKSKKKQYVRPKTRQSLAPPSRPGTEKRPAPAPISSVRTPLRKKLCLGINTDDANTPA